MVGQTISHYQILEKLGQGGMGIVYKAQDLKLDRLVALKFLPPHLDQSEEEKARFIQEAKAASALDHPNICTIYEIDETVDGQIFIAMGFYEGETLKKKVNSNQLSVDSVIDIAIQIAQGLGKAHQQGIVHRDIKPVNVMITKDGAAKILDFGLAKFAGQTRLTKTGTTVGTPAYMSPEQINLLDVDHRTDIWSLGVVLYEMITNHLPFRGEYEQAVMYSIINEKPEPLARYKTGVPDGLQHIIDKALDKDRETRYQHADDLLADLKRERKSSSSSVKPSVAIKESLSRKKLWMRLGAVAVLAIIASVLILLPQRRSELNPNATFRTLPIPFTEIQYPGLSQDGSWVAFPAADANGKWEVYLMNTSGGEPRRITSSDSSLAEITMTDISPDGSQIVYNPFNRKTQKDEIYIVSSLGGLSKRIVEIGMIPRWRPDGQRIGYILGPDSSPSKSGKREIWSVKPDGSDNRLEFVDSVGTKGYNTSLSWSPDGQSVAWLRTFPQGYKEVIVRELATGKERQLTFDQKFIDEVCWTRRDEILFSSNKAGNWNLWMVPVAGGQAIQITKGTGGELGVQISADRKKLLYLRTDWIGYLWIANSDGSGARQITFDERWIFALSFSPDGRRLLIGMNDPDATSSSQIYLMDRDGSNRQQLSLDSERAHSAAWSSDGQWIAYSSSPGLTPSDSASVYLIAVSNPSAPRLLGKGTDIWWINSKILVVSRQFKNWLLSIDGAPPQKFYEDSTQAYPILEEKYVLFKDFRKGREGWWIVSVSGLNGPSTGPPQKILPENPYVTIAPNGKLLLYYATNAGEVRKMSLPDGKNDLFPVQLSDLALWGACVSYDGKEIVYTEPRNRAKLVMIENPFK